MTQPTLQKLCFKEVHELCSSNDRGHIHEERRLWIEELDEWRAHKPKTHDKPKLRQKEFDTSPNQLKASDKVLLDATDPHIVTTTPKEEIPLIVLSIFPFGVSTETRPSTWVCLRPYENRAKEFPNTGCDKMPRPCDMAVVEPVKTTRDYRVDIPRAHDGTMLNVPSLDRNSEIEEFREENELHALSRHIHFSPSKCWHTLAPSTASYNPSRSKASVLPPSLRYLHAILAYTITGRRDSTGVTERHRKGVISIGPYVTQLARHFGLLNTAAQESFLTLIGQMSPKGISSILSMRMIERHRGTYLPRYRLTQSIEEEAYEDIPDDFPPQHEDLPTQPPPPSLPVHATASYADISERLTRFEHQCFQ
ncbi:hypothetical protein GOBAR_AA07971 [Gossypium barbadense]|uniref:Uncharacterized protein n=1 Tax=Gossypium barbadense TaxID=3634 RepID=A0A2P5YAQ3_GOSBA|nr:hypothetical protein GOBAR_AA07971 [Gossypium barbadense]